MDEQAIPPRRSWREVVPSRGDARQHLGAFAALVLLGIILSFLSPFFFTVGNLLNVVLQSAINLVIAVGMTFVIISAGIDLSVGSVLGVSGVVMALLVRNAAWPAAALAGIGIGALFGVLNGLLITRGRIPPFIATLGMLAVARSLALILTQARPVFGLPSGFQEFGAGAFLRIPTPVLMAAGVALAGAFLLRRTTFGRYTYALGSNRDAARRFGINIRRHELSLYVVSGITAALAAVIQTARLNAADPNAGLLYELDAIAAVVIGGTRLSGGAGTVGGTVVGALIMGTLRNGLNLLNVEAYYQQLAIGLVIIGAVLVDQLRK